MRDWDAWSRSLTDQLISAQNATGTKWLSESNVPLDPNSLVVTNLIAESVREGMRPFGGFEFTITTDSAFDGDAYYSLTIEVPKLGYKYKDRVSRSAALDPAYYQETWVGFGKKLQDQIRYRAGLDVPDNIERGEN